MTSICEKKISAEVWLIHAEQMSLYNFIILRKKRLQHRCFPVEFVKLSRTVSRGNCSPSRATIQTYFRSFTLPQTYCGCPKTSGEYQVTPLNEKREKNYFFCKLIMKGGNVFYTDIYIR